MTATEEMTVREQEKTGDAVIPPQQIHEGSDSDQGEDEDSEDWRSQADGYYQ